MLFNIYSACIASNESTNITKHGSFEAESWDKAYQIIEFNFKYKNCEKWQIPVTFDKQTCNYVQPNYVKALHDNFRWKPFVCAEDDKHDGLPLERNMIWKDKSSVGPNFFIKK